MEEEFIHSADGSETVVDDKEATIRNLLREIKRLRADLKIWKDMAIHAALVRR